MKSDFENIDFLKKICLKKCVRVHFFAHFDHDKTLLYSVIFPSSLCRWMLLIDENNFQMQMLSTSTMIWENVQIIVIICLRLMHSTILQSRIKVVLKETLIYVLNEIGMIEICKKMGKNLKELASIGNMTDIEITQLLSHLQSIATPISKLEVYSFQMRYLGVLSNDLPFCKSIK